MSGTGMPGAIMARTLAELDHDLDRLEAMLPALIEAYPDDEIWAAFAGESDVIEDAAGDYAAHVRGRIDHMLAAQGLIPSDLDTDAP
jgi:hypothetical protein